MRGYFVSSTLEYNLIDNICICDDGDDGDDERRLADTEDTFD